MLLFVLKQKTAYGMRISDWSSDVCSSDLRKLLDGLRYLLKEEFKLNQAGPADGWLTQDALWLVSKTVSDKLRAHLLSQGIDGIPASNTAVFNVLQDHGIEIGRAHV